MEVWYIVYEETNFAGYVVSSNVQKIVAATAMGAITKFFELNPGYPGNAVKAVFKK